MSNKRIDLTQFEGTMTEYETLIEAISYLNCHLGVLSDTIGYDGEYLKPRENNLDLMRAMDLLTDFRKALQEREQNAQSRSDLLAELQRCYELIDELENPSDEDERYPEPDELTPSNTSRAGADWPSGPRM